MADPRKIKLVLAYDGTRYHGWQFQKNGLSIQAVLEEKISVMTREQVKVIGSGRTDAGVHALGQVCHFETGARLEPDEFLKGLNSLLPADILVRRAEDVSPAFHARYSAKSKVYEYRILNRPEPDVFLRHYVWHISRPLDLKALARCLPLVQGEHDFTSFRSSGSNNQNPVRHILRSELRGPEDGLIRLVFEANGFLRHMVRSMSGTLVDVGTGKTSVEGFLDILRARDRQKAGLKAPAGGLFLVRVVYEGDGQAPAAY
ncbi:MAG: tRNA pseudouridine(38-40) synthase TruA [Thermodesulfobacteriota bacterium]